MKLVLTGSTGFVGSKLLTSLSSYDVTVIGRTKPKSSLNYKFYQAEINSAADYLPALSGADILIHSAARVHIMDDNVTDPLAEFRAINTEGTVNLAKQAAEAGVKRFIFISSIKVNGESTSLNNPFRPDGEVAPQDPYGVSKAEAEEGLKNIAKETGLEVVIIRPPLVYGPNVKANFSTMMKWINKGVPLPLGAIHNQRSFVALDNLVGFIIRCIDHPKAANEVFLISDDEDVSTSELLRKVAKAFGKKALLLPIPVWLMTSVAKLVGKGDVANRLFGSLQVDSSKARELLGWKPVITMDEQLKKTADTYLEHEKTL